MLAKPRSRTLYAVAVLVTIFVGLASRMLPRSWPEIVSKYPGDALWALMVLFGWAMIWSKLSTQHVGLITLGTCILVEVLKLYQARWLVDLRQTTLGHLVFGHAFSWGNLAAYSVGTVAGVFFDRYLQRPSET